jgi:hypothetical protein
MSCALSHTMGGMPRMDSGSTSRSFSSSGDAVRMRHRRADAAMLGFDVRNGLRSDAEFFAHSGDDDACAGITLLRALRQVAVFLCAGCG